MFRNFLERSWKGQQLDLLKRLRRVQKISSSFVDCYTSNYHKKILLTCFFYIKFLHLNLIKIQSPLTYLRTYDITHSCFVTHFRIPKVQEKKIFFIVAQIRFIVYFQFKICF